MTPTPTTPTRPPTFADVLAAQRIVERHLPWTPLVQAQHLAPRHKGAIGLKLDALSALGSFKPRGVLCRMAKLSPAKRRAGVVTASTGNHGLAVAWAARAHDAPATVVLPRSAPEFKAGRIRGQGATVVRAGADWNASLAHAQRLAAETGATLIEDGDDPWVMAGAGTMALEALRQAPDTDCLVVPVGGGNLIAGAAIAAKGLRKDIRIVGVQSSAAQGTYRSWKAGKLLLAPCDTFAGGIATAGPARLSLDVMLDLVDDVQLVTERELMLAIGDVFRGLSVVIEGAAAAPVAALRRYPRVFKGNLALLVTGRTLDEATLRKALALRR